MRVTVHIPDNLGPKLKRAAHDEGISVSALTAKAVEAYLKQRRKKAAGNRLLGLIRRGSVAPDAWEEIERGRADDRA
jgi:antitoxin VapB